MLLVFQLILNNEIVS